MKGLKYLEKRMPQLEALCEKHRVARLYAFGSVLTDRFHLRRSDLDLQVMLEPMPPLEKGETLLNLWEDLEDLFERKVDLLTDQPIINPYFQEEVETKKQLIYEQVSQEMLV